MAEETHQPLARVIRPLVWCREDERVREVATRMAQAAQSYMLVQTARGLGIVTDHDFRRLVGTGDVPVDAPIARLASVPAITIEESATAATALLRMVEHGVHHLVVTADTAPVGVVRAVDLAQFEVREPLLLRTTIDSAANLAALGDGCRSIPTALAELRDNGIPARHVGAVHAALVDAVLRRVLAIRADPVFAEVRHSWILLGSLARREPLPSSDLDTALIWFDPPPSAPDPADAILEAAAGVLGDLHHCGLTPCPSGTRADNPLFSRSKSAWATAATNWLHDPTANGALLLSAMVADSRPVTQVDLGHDLTETLMSHTRTSQFLRALLDEAVRWRTSTGFLRDFTVKRTGAHRGQLDLKRGGLVAVVALGRWIAIVTGDGRGTTSERLDRGAEAGLLTDDELHTLVGGFDSIYTVLYDLEIHALRSGETPTTYLRPRDLDSLTRRHLRETLRAINVVQNRVDQSWIRRLDD
jgi:CBS domain-containing protein